jgi:hypothetical protein
LRGARRDQPRLGLCQAAEQRGQREHDESEHEHLAAPHQVGETPAEQQKAAERERVGVDYPREVVLREMQRATDRRQRDVDDRRVDHDDELRHREQGKGEVLCASWTGGHAILSVVGRMVGTVVSETNGSV